MPVMDSVFRDERFGKFKTDVLENGRGDLWVLNFADEKIVEREIPAKLTAILPVLYDNTVAQMISDTEGHFSGKAVGRVMKGFPTTETHAFVLGEFFPEQTDRREIMGKNNPLLPKARRGERYDFHEQYLSYDSRAAAKYLDSLIPEVNLGKLVRKKMAPSLSTLQFAAYGFCDLFKDKLYFDALNIAEDVKKFSLNIEIAGKVEGKDSLMREKFLKISTDALVSALGEIEKMRKKKGLKCKELEKLSDLEDALIIIGKRTLGMSDMILGIGARDIR